MRQYPGGYADYIRQRGPRDAGESRSTSKSSVASLTSQSSQSPAKRKLSYNEKRELDALPARIEALEKEIAAIEADLVAGRIYTSERLAPAQEELENLVDRWAELEEKKQ